MPDCGSDAYAASTFGVNSRGDRVPDRNGGDSGCLCSKNLRTQRDARPARLTRSSAFTVWPATLGTDQQCDVIRRAHPVKRLEQGLTGALLIQDQPVIGC